MATLQITVKAAPIVQHVQKPQIRKLCELLENVQKAVNAVEAWGVEQSPLGSSLVQASSDVPMDVEYQNLVGAGRER